MKYSLTYINFSKLGVKVVPDIRLPLFLFSILHLFIFFLNILSPLRPMLVYVKIACTDVILKLETLINILVNRDNLLAFTMHRFCQVFDQHVPPNGFRLRHNGIAGFHRRRIVTSCLIICRWHCILLSVHFVEKLFAVLKCDRENFFRVLHSFTCTSQQFELTRGHLTFNIINKFLT